LPPSHYGAPLAAPPARRFLQPHHMAAATSHGQRKITLVRRTDPHPPPGCGSNRDGLFTKIDQSRIHLVNSVVRRHGQIKPASR
jgi:hypothetical protein